MGQALARPANFINQGLYGPPTQLSWGIPIDASHRLPQFADLSQFPDTTRFHPTFAYEMILNLLIVLFLWWLSRRYEENLKPGALFSIWLILAGLSRTTIEFFRPDQPRIGDTFISYTMLAAFGMAILGLVMLLARYGRLQLAAAEGWEEEYQVKKVEKKQRPVRTGAASAPSRPASASVDQKVMSKRSANAVRPSSAKTSKRKPVKKKPAANTRSKASKR